ncbi:hypothetical protein Nepgr_018354 [Nepenthes gracilis]|uniref:Uncharacterized protein n=1 Tax=Nepenthes gracilis TaxID=150966 RepID=A0AAD3XTC7_NEPGR|nr:hypothetical protein Nepgr_018354 [Nepenthes gracilis]
MVYAATFVALSAAIDLAAFSHKRRKELCSDDRDSFSLKPQIFFFCCCYVSSVTLLVQPPPSPQPSQTFSLYFHYLPLFKLFLHTVEVPEEDIVIMGDLTEEEQVIPDVKPVAPLQFRMMMRRKHHQIVQLHYGAFMPPATEEVIYSEGIVLFDGDGARTLK